MRRLNGKVTIIPILAKADTMTAAEVIEFKRLVVDTLNHEGIKTFQEPFAVIASASTDVDEQGERSRTHGGA